MHIQYTSAMPLRAMTASPNPTPDLNPNPNHPLSTTAAGLQRLTPTRRHHYNKRGGRARRRTTLNGDTTTMPWWIGPVDGPS